MKRRTITLALLLVMACSARAGENGPVSIRITAPVETVKSALVMMASAENYVLESDTPYQMTFSKEATGFKDYMLATILLGNAYSDTPRFIMQLQFSHAGGITTVTSTTQIAVRMPLGNVNRMWLNGKKQRAIQQGSLDRLKVRAEAAETEKDLTVSSSWPADDKKKADEINREARHASDLDKWREANRTTKAGILCQKHPDWQPEICEEIAAQEVRLGMNAEQVKLSWGEPTDIDLSIAPSFRSDHWVYSKLGQDVYLKNGIVTSVGPPQAPK